MNNADTSDATSILDEDDASIDQPRRNPAGLTTFLVVYRNRLVRCLI